jgi:hypothetical protein
MNQHVKKKGMCPYSIACQYRYCRRHARIFQEKEVALTAGLDSIKSSSEKGFSVTNKFVSRVSFPLVGNPSSERLRTSLPAKLKAGLPASGGAEGDQGRSDKKQYHTYVLLSKCFFAIVMISSFLAKGLIFLKGGP